ncbi:MAG: nickel pincer cofactor biosynthesis protein LarC [bacterium]|nr:nickel pincer cofactor biosynthesis protein LarC [bacterium]
MKTAYFDCFSGISGDMILGSLIDAGLDFNRFKKELGFLNLKEYSLQAKKVKRGSLMGTKFDVIINKNAKGRAYNEIIKLIKNSGLNKKVKEKSLKIFQRLAVSEAKLHGVPVSKVHFHELSSIDTIVDIVGSVIAFDILGIEKIYSSSLPLGQGVVKTMHGMLPVPAPATADLLRDVPVRLGDGTFELVTPTGAVIISEMSDGFGKCPEMKIKNIGYGAGGRDLPNTPNLLRVIIGESSENEEEDIITVIETNIDDMNPQILGYLMEKLMQKGALDVFFTPVYGKKNRPGILLTVLSEIPKADNFIKIILEETTVFGVRMYETRRKKLKREIKEVKTKYGKVKVKYGYLNGKIIKSQPEYEDCKKIAEEKNIQLNKILREI